MWPESTGAAQSAAAHRSAFRARALAGEKLLGTVIASPDQALAEAAAVQLDFLWIDLEHSPLTIADVQSLCIAAKASACAALVRVPHPHSEMLTALLDIGVDGVIAPRVEDPAVAASFAASLRYPPQGTRGLASRRARRYGLDPDDQQHVPLCLVQIESRLAVQNAERIARMDGVDGLIAGPTDLACDLGLPQDLSSAEMLDALAEIRCAAARAGVISGLAAAGSGEVVVRALGESSTMLAYSADVRIYAQALAGATSLIAKAWGRNAAAEADHEITG
jgi:2-keto-3-deoxy-L-rhamnonate aldolase RhmA